MIQPWMSNTKTLPTPDPRRSVNNTPVLLNRARCWRRDDVESDDLAIRQPVQIDAARRNQALARLQPEPLPSGFHKAAGLNRHSNHTRGLKAALAADHPTRTEQLLAFLLTA